MKDKIVVITGGGKGLGKELAKTLASEKSYVVICSRNKADLENVREEISKNGGKCDYQVVDVTDEAQVYNFVDAVAKKHGRMDVLINNAGYVNEWKPVDENTEKEFDDNFKTNVYSIFYFLKKTVPVMKKQNSGAIINISSMAGKRGLPNLAAYSASKFAVIGFTQSIAKELKDNDVMCIAVCPGGMHTDMRAKVFGQEDAEKQQEPAFVASVIKDVLLGKIEVPNGGDIVIRHGKISSINSPPE